MIAVIDYGAGNVGSVLKAVQRLGYPAERVDRSEPLTRAQKVIFPGQGHFGSMIAALRERCFLSALREILQSGTPFLGICLGFQALYEASEEAPESPGLGIFSGRVQRLTGIFKVPHVGWSQLEIERPTRLLSGVAPGSFVYYCHSYYCPATHESAAFTEYGQRFAAAAEARNIFAVQFHPEKSGDVGLKIFRNFLEL